MPATRTQTYATHRRINPVQHGVVWPLLVLNLAALTAAAVRAPSWATILGAATAFALVLLAVGVRSMLVVLQDRIIRLEQRLRLERILPEDLRGRIGELSLRQLVALRFAGDREVAELVRRALAGELATPDAIKRAVTDWQPDHQRV